MDFDKEIINTLYSINWFSNCGKAILLENAEVLPDVSKVKKSIQSRRYENVVLDYRGDFTSALSISDREQYNKWWNLLTEQFKSQHIPELSRSWERGLSPLKLSEENIVCDVCFNIMAIAIIGAYKEQIPMPDFFKRMLAIYQSGHLVCGWSGNKNNGKFIVY